MNNNPDSDVEDLLQLLEARDAAVDRGEMVTYSWEEVLEMLPKDRRP